jgi:HAD superfamily hydrolase (TIGR01484 family)
MPRYRFVVSDIDGCLTPGRGKLIDADVFKELKEIGDSFRTSQDVPWIGLITARPQPYLEAILQLIGNETIGLFEWGCGLFQPFGYRCLFHPLLTPPRIERIAHYKAMLSRYLAEKRLGFIQFGKECAMTIYPFPNSTHSVESLREEVQKWLNSIKPVENFRVEITRTFVNLMPEGIDKQSGLKWMLEVIGIAPEECIGIGDGEDDLPFLSICGYSAAPANAAQTVKEKVSFSSRFDFGHGALDSLRNIL